jgi:hypothetical protein
MSTATALDFLRLVLPAEGWKVACRKTPKGMQQKFFKTHEELLQQLLAWSDGGYDTYHACATFKDASSRKVSNVLHVQSFWLDIDTRVGKPDAPYADQVEAAQAVGKFCAEIRLHPPTLINSGAGVHAYWPLYSPLTVDEWLRYASGLKRACTIHGLHADPARTADAASILRTPGTMNFKHAQ